jgi:hypothetical protein
MGKAKISVMSPDILAIVIATTIQVLVSVTGFVLLGWKLSQTLRQITAEVTFNVLQGRRIEEALSEMRESIREMRQSPGR